MTTIKLHTLLVSYQYLNFLYLIVLMELQNRDSHYRLYLMKTVILTLGLTVKVVILVFEMTITNYLKLN